MKNAKQHHPDTRGHYMNAFTRTAFLFFALLIAWTAQPTMAQAQSGNDALTSIDAIMRYMTSDNYAKEDLVRRVVWTDKLITEVVGYTPNDDNRQRFMELLDLGITQFQNENARLRVLVRAISTLDPLIQKYFPQWIVMDEAMILEIMRKVRDNRDDMGDDDAVLIADRVLTGKARIRIIRSIKSEDNLIALVIERARPRNPENAGSGGFSANPDNPDYEDYRLVGEKNIRNVLANLYDGVVARDSYANRIETGSLQMQPDNAEATISIPFGGGFMWTLPSENPIENNTGVKPERIRAGFELKIGNDWVNLPFLYGPQWNALFVYEPSSYEHLKFGPAIPFTWGDESINRDIVILKNRKLNGSWGFTGEYFRQLSGIGSATDDADGIGAAAYVSFGLSTLGTRKITNANGEIINGTGMKPYYRDNHNLSIGLPRLQNGKIDPAVLKNFSFYYLTSTATLYYWRDLGFLMNGLRIHGGLGYQKVNEARHKWEDYDGAGSLDPAVIDAVADTVQVIDGTGTLDAFLRLTYDHRGKTTYGASLQYFNGGLMGVGYLNIFSWLRAEVKYSRVVFRDPEVWEHQEVVVPGLRINFNF